jgi:hypothetical protein
LPQTATAASTWTEFLTQNWLLLALLFLVGAEKFAKLPGIIRSARKNGSNGHDRPTGVSGVFPRPVRQSDAKPHSPVTYEALDAEIDALCDRIATLEALLNGQSGLVASVAGINALLKRLEAEVQALPDQVASKASTQVSGQLFQELGRIRDLLRGEVTDEIRRQLGAA